MLSHDKEYLKSIVDFVNSYTNKYGLILSAKKTHIYKLDNFNFLKRNWGLTKSGKVMVRPSSKNIRRIKRKYRKLAKRNRKVASDYLKSINGYLQQFEKGGKICIN